MWLNMLTNDGSPAFKVQESNTVNWLLITCRFPPYRDNRRLWIGEDGDKYTRMPSKPIAEWANFVS